MRIIEYPSVKSGLGSYLRAKDINDASSVDDCRAIFSVVGGDDSITLLKYLDREKLATSAAPFVGYSDNTAIHNYLWKLGRVSYYGGSTQVQLGAGSHIDCEQLASISNVLRGTGALEIMRPESYEVRGCDWSSPLALTEGGMKAPYPNYIWDGAREVIRGRSWGGCIQTIMQLGIMNELPDVRQLDGAVLFLELSDDHLGDGNVLKIIRALGEAGYFEKAGALLFGLPPRTVQRAERFYPQPGEAVNFLRSVSREIGYYNHRLPRVLGLPIGHLRPQYIIPYGGTIEVDAINRKVKAFYG